MINRQIIVPTGKIFVLDGKGGQMECLSLADYGQPKNCKAQFLGLNDEINGVDNDNPLLPLEEKWVITISTQYGCQCNCKFCDVPKIQFGGNIEHVDMMKQVSTVLSNELISRPKRINVHYARMGEPTFNTDVLVHARFLKEFIDGFFAEDVVVHPVVSTMMPSHNKQLESFLAHWIKIKNYVYNGDAGLQLSINSTDNKQRDNMFRGQSLQIEEIARIARKFDMPRGRKYTLNFALSDETIIDAQYLAELFGTEKFMVKITPMHGTKSCTENSIKTSNGYDSFTPYKKVEEELISHGFDVLVFVPSKDEEDGRITCGNAILSDGKSMTL